MGRTSKHLSRRDVLRGAGLAMALPWLEGMGLAADRAASDIPKRLIVSYISYGVYEPKAKDGKHHDWNWWPCAKAGPLSFNASSAPFAPLKDSITYLRGLDHAGGYGLGGHSSGDVFATGADMSGTEVKNNISLEQLAAKHHGHKTRYNSLVPIRIPWRLMVESERP